MKITLTESGGSPVTLCDHGREGPCNLVPTAMRKVEVLPFVQGTYSAPKNRGNTLNQLTFSVSVEHATFAAAQLYVFQLGDTLPKTGQLAIELEDQQTWLVADDATLEYTVLPLLGVMSTVSYTIKYGAIAEPANLIGNGTFDTDITDWTFDTGDGVATCKSVDGVAHIDITTPSTSGSAMALKQSLGMMEVGKAYQLRFRVKHTPGELAWNTHAYVGADGFSGNNTSCSFGDSAEFEEHFVTHIATAAEEGWVAFYSDVSMNGLDVWIDDVKVIGAYL